MTKPQQILEEAGAQTKIISPNSNRVQGWNHFDKGIISRYEMSELFSYAGRIQQVV